MKETMYWRANPALNVEDRSYGRDHSMACTDHKLSLPWPRQPSLEPIFSAFASSTLRLIRNVIGKLSSPRLDGRSAKRAFFACSSTSEGLSVRPSEQVE